MFTQDSLFSCNDAIHKGPFFFAKHLQRSLMELAIFTTEGLTERSNSGPLNPKLNAATNATDP